MRFLEAQLCWKSLQLNMYKNFADVVIKKRRLLLSRFENVVIEEVIIPIHTGIAGPVCASGKLGRCVRD